MSQIESTYKARDVEETIDIYFYRPVGYWIARVCQTLGITPNSLTIVGIFIGVCGGHLLYYRDFTTNVWGIILWVIASTLDSVDGQLARLTNHKSKVGRILDGGCRLHHFLEYLSSPVRANGCHVSCRLVSPVAIDPGGSREPLSKARLPIIIGMRM